MSPKKTAESPPTTGTYVPKTNGNQFPPAKKPEADIEDDAIGRPDPTPTPTTNRADDIPASLRQLAKEPNAETFGSALILEYLYPSETDLDKLKEAWRNNVGPHIERMAAELPVEWAALRSPKVLRTWPPTSAPTTQKNKPKPPTAPTTQTTGPDLTQLRTDIERLADFLTSVGLDNVADALEFAKEREKLRKQIAESEAKLLARFKAKSNGN